MTDELTLMRQTLASIQMQIESLQRKATILDMEIKEMEAENEIKLQRPIPHRFP